MCSVTAPSTGPRVSSSLTRPVHSARCGCGRAAAHTGYRRAGRSARSTTSSRSASLRHTRTASPASACRLALRAIGGEVDRVSLFLETSLKYPGHAGFVLDHEYSHSRACFRLPLVRDHDNRAMGVLHDLATD